MKQLTVLFKLTFCLISFGLAMASSPDYKVTDVAKSVIEPWPLDSFASMVRGGVNSAVSFPWNAAMAMLDPSKSGQLMSEVLSAITGQLGLLIPAGVGLLTAVLIIPCSCCFCCCRLCGRCGAKVDARPTRSNVTRNCNAVGIVICIGILSAMAITMPLGGERMLASPKLLTDALAYSLMDVPKFLSKLVTDSMQVAVEGINNLLDEAKKTLADFAAVVLVPLKKAASAFTEPIVTQANKISKAVASLPDVATGVSDSVDRIIHLVGELNRVIVGVQKNMTTLKNSCAATITQGSFCNKLQFSEVKSVSLDKSLLKTVSGDISKLEQQTRTVDVSSYVDMSSGAFSSVESTIKSNTQNAVDDIMKKLDDIPAMFIPVINQTLQMVDVSILNKTVGNKLGSVQKSVETFYNLVGSKVYVGGALLAGPLALIVLITAIGCGIGFFKTLSQSTYTVGSDAQTSSLQQPKSCASSTLMCSVAMSVLPVMVLLLVGSLLLPLGGLLTVACTPIQDLTLVEKLVDSGALTGGKNIGQMFLRRESASISLAKLIRVCRGGGTFLGGLGLSNLMDMSQLSGGGSFKLTLPPDVYKKINDSIAGVSLVDTSSLDSLADKLKFPELSVSDIKVLPKSEADASMNKFITEIRQAAPSFNIEFFTKSLEGAAKDLEDASKNFKEPLYEEIGYLTNNITFLQQQGEQMKNAITVLSATLNELQEFVGAKAASIVTQTVEKMVKDMSGAQVMNNLLQKLATDVGQCKPIADIYDSTTGAICYHFLNAFNVCWASMFVAGFVCVILMCTNCSLEKYFRLPNAQEELPVSRFDNISQSNAFAIAHEAAAVRTNISNNATSNPSHRYGPFWKSSFKRSSYSTQKRGKYSTGSDSPQLLRIQQLDGNLNQTLMSVSQLQNCEHTNFPNNSANNANMAENSVEIRADEMAENNDSSIDSVMDMMNMFNEEAQHVGVNGQDVHIVFPNDSAAFYPVSNGTGDRCKNENSPSKEMNKHSCELMQIKQSPSKGRPMNSYLNEHKNVTNIIENGNMGKSCCEEVHADVEIEDEVKNTQSLNEGNCINDGSVLNVLTNASNAARFDSKEQTGKANILNINKNNYLRKANIVLDRKLAVEKIGKNCSATDSTETNNEECCERFSAGKSGSWEMLNEDIDIRAEDTVATAELKHDDSDEVTTDKSMFLNTPTCKIKCSLCKTGGYQSKIGLRYAAATPLVKGNTFSPDVTVDEPLVNLPNGHISSIPNGHISSIPNGHISSIPNGHISSIPNGHNESTKSQQAFCQSLENSLNEFELAYNKMADKDRGEKRDTNVKDNTTEEQFCYSEPSKSDRPNADKSEKAGFYAKNGCGFDGSLNEFQSLYKKLALKQRTYKGLTGSSRKSEGGQLVKRIPERRRKSLNVEVRPYREKLEREQQLLDVSSDTEDFCYARGPISPVCNFVHEGNLLSEDNNRNCSKLAVLDNSKSQISFLNNEMETEKYVDRSATTQASFAESSRARQYVCEGQLVELLQDLERCLDTADGCHDSTHHPKPLSLLASKSLLGQATSKCMPLSVYESASMQMKSCKTTYV